jgi:hypothetical protein
LIWRTASFKEAASVAPSRENCSSRYCRAARTFL